MTLSPQRQNEYQKAWVAKRRAKWFAGKSCVDCNSTQDLRLDHIDPSLKVSHKIWSWSWERIEIETAKCAVRCQPCHVKKTRENGEHAKGSQHGMAVLTEEKVLDIRAKYAVGNRTQTDIAQEYGVSKDTVSGIVRRKYWKHI